MKTISKEIQSNEYQNEKVRLVGGVGDVIAVVGLLAAFLVLGSNPAVTDAHEGAQDDTHCAGMSRAQQLGHDLRATDPVQPASTHHTCADASNAPSGTGNGGNGGNGMESVSPLVSSSSTGSAGVKLTLTVPLTEDLTGSSWVEIYLEDDYQEPGSIAKDECGL